MEFGYFTLSDNHYEGNTRGANQFVADITAEALHADQLGMHSAWIGEHHFNALGVLSCPDLVLAQIAALTKQIRLAPAVTVLPLHNPIRVAEQWATLDLISNGRVDFAAGRGYDRREYELLRRQLRRQSGAVRGRHGDRAQPLGCGRADRPQGQILPVRGYQHHAEAGAESPARLYRLVLETLDRTRAPRLGCGLIVAPFAAAISYGGLKQVAELYHETCAKYGTKPGRLMCIGRNRCLTEAPVPYDNDVDVITAVRTDNQEKPVLFLTGCHPVFNASGREGVTLSANYPAAARKKLEGDGIAHAVFIQGCAGDINPQDASHTNTGHALAADVRQVMARPLQKITGGITYYTDSVVFPVKPMAERSGAGHAGSQ